MAEPFLKNFPGEPEQKLRAAMIFQDRICVMSELDELVKDLLCGCEEYPAERLVWKKSTSEEAKERLSGIRTFIESWREGDFESIEEIEKKIKAFIKDKGWGNGDTLWPLRVALSGQEKSPSPFEYIFVFRKEECIRRIDAGLQTLA